MAGGMDSWSCSSFRSQANDGHRIHVIRGNESSRQLMQQPDPETQVSSFAPASSASSSSYAAHPQLVPMKNTFCRSNSSSSSFPRQARSFIMSTTSTSSSSNGHQNNDNSRPSNGLNGQIRDLRITDGPDGQNLSQFQELEPLQSEPQMIPSQPPSLQSSLPPSPTKLTPSVDHGFPEKFYLALREIFDVLDDKKVGLLSVAEIESRWVDDESSMFSPRGLVECLHQVSPADGYIDFERFCAAIKICLLKNQNSGQQNASSNLTNGRKKPSSSGNLKLKNRPSSVPVPDQMLKDGDHNLDMEDELEFKSGLKTYIKPQNVLSMTNGNTANGNSPSLQLPMRRVSSEVPVKPERHTVPRSRSKSRTKSVIGVLKGWRDTVIDKTPNLVPNLRNTFNGHKSPPPQMPPTVPRDHEMELPSNFQSSRNLQTMLSNGNNLFSNGQNMTQSLSNSNNMRGRRRDRERRSTVASGVDYNQLKRLTLLQHEKDLLLRGLQAVDRTKDWYLRQMNLVQEKIRICSKSSFNFNGSEPLDMLQEKLQFKANRIITANQSLVALMDEANFPIHMNLAFKPLLAPHSMVNIHDNADSIDNQRLQEQNQQLSNEVANKRQMINQLQQEKSALLSMLQSRSSSVASTNGGATAPVLNGNSIYHHNNQFMSQNNQHFQKLPSQSSNNVAGYSVNDSPYV